MRQLFIYWKLAPERRADALAAARQWQAGLRAAHPGLRTGLYQRSDAAAHAEGAVTFMETYAMVSGIGIGIGSALEAAINAAGSAGLQPLGAPRRHVEAFDAIEVPAD